MIFDQIYIIILEKRYRYAISNVKNLLDFGYDISKIKFFKAVHGKEINVDFKYSLYPHWVLEDTENVWWKKPISEGELGCALSHISVWKDAYYKSYRNILILEEDFFIKDNHDVYMSLFQNLKLEYDIFYMGKNNIYPDTDSEVSDMIKCTGYSYNTHAYSISREGMRKALNSNFNQNIIPVDEFLNVLFKKHPRKDLYGIYNVPDLFRCFCFNENIIGQTSNGQTEL